MWRFVGRMVKYLDMKVENSSTVKLQILPNQATVKLGKMPVVIVSLNSHPPDTFYFRASFSLPMHFN